MIIQCYKGGVFFVKWNICKNWLIKKIYYYRRASTSFLHSWCKRNVEQCWNMNHCSSWKPYCRTVTVGISLLWFLLNLHLFCKKKGIYNTFFFEKDFKSKVICVRILLWSCTAGCSSFWNISSIFLSLSECLKWWYKDMTVLCIFSHLRISS